MTVISKTLSAAGQLLTGTAPHNVQVFRKATCYACKSVKNTPNVGLTCGPYLQPTDNTCGCVIEDKIEVAGESCPQKKWKSTQT